MIMAVRIHLFPFRASAKRDTLPKVPVYGKRQNTEVKICVAESTWVLTLGERARISQNSTVRCFAARDKVAAYVRRNRDRKRRYPCAV